MGVSINQAGHFIAYLTKDDMPSDKVHGSDINLKTWQEITIILK